MKKVLNTQKDTFALHTESTAQICRHQRKGYIKLVTVSITIVRIHFLFLLSAYIHLYNSINILKCQLT